MAQFPALPLFTDAFISDTTHLSASQTGAYLMLLIVAWRTHDCKLPDDDRLLARYARMDLRTWKANRDTVMAFWKKDDMGNWYQARLLDERKYVSDMSIKNSIAGKISALKRKERHPTNVPTEFQQNSNPHTHTHIIKENITKEKGRKYETKSQRADAALARAIEKTGGRTATPTAITAITDQTKL